MAKMTKYMQAQIREDDWIKVETSHGVQWLEKDVVGIPKEWNGTFTSKELSPRLVMFLEEFFAIYATSFEVVHGFGARLSAPGYLDYTGSCTDWCVFNTVGEALDHIKELRE